MLVSFKRIGQNMRKIREIAGLRQEEVADLLGMSLTHYSNLERAKRKVKLETIARFCKVMNVSVESILHSALEDIDIRNMENTGKQDEDEFLIYRFSQIIIGCEPVTKQYMIELCERFAEVEKLEKR